MDDYQSWIGRQERCSDVATASAAGRLAALLDHANPPWPAGALPPLGHWLCFLPNALQSDIDGDGHPRRGGFLPPIPLPRRMWAGGRLDFLTPIEIRDPLERLSTITAINFKQGSSGPLAFVTLRHEVFANGVLAVVEEQDLVYRDAEGTRAPTQPPAPPTPDRFTVPTRIITPDPTLLLRFSALTFNAHRIHYDRDYARDVEHYAGLVVHGPLIATLLMDLWLRETGTNPVRFTFRAQRPLLDTAPFGLCFDRTETGATLWSQDAQGNPSMSAEVITG